MKPEVAQTAVQNQTATMLEISSSLLNQSAAQSRKLTDVEAQVPPLPPWSPQPSGPWQGAQGLCC